MKNQLSSDLHIRGRILSDEPMYLHTSLKTGGPADLYAIPEDAEDLLYLLKELGERGIPWLTIGRGYNLLVRDKGIRGAVVSLERFNSISAISGSLIKAEAGVENLSVVRFAQKYGLGGIGFISGIPGTIGGAIKMNAGAYGEGILERTDHLTLLRSGNISDFRMDELDYGYRHLRLEDGDIVLSATFRLNERDASLTEEEIRKDLELRRLKHNVGFPSAGSFFKNPAGCAAWRLIDAAGMRGARIGGAQVSEVHSNFLVNTGSATTDDFLALSTKVINAVLSTSGVTLEEEVRIVGEI
ncbi:MAG: UDP-N-acetylmuramate dehydrogenase [Desulfuromonadaceae bacterium]|nr:UDP-N-acetylmuramate dehydrogenase [Desulfuromonadaceae bacterium]